MSSTGGIEVGNIVNENNRRLDGGKGKATVKVPVFAAHSAHDKTARLGGLISFMEDHVGKALRSSLLSTWSMAACRWTRMFRSMIITTMSFLTHRLPIRNSGG